MKQQESIGPTAERLARAGKDVEPVNTEPDTNPNYKNTVRLLDGSILDMLASRGVITGDQYGAGTQFYADWYYSGLANSGVIDPCRVVVDGEASHGQSDAKLDAATRWRRAVQAVGLVHSHVLTEVVLMEERMEAYGQRRFGLLDLKDARLAARVCLVNALTALDHHYYGQRRKDLKSSHSAGYRPEILPLDDHGGTRV